MPHPVVILVPAILLAGCGVVSSGPAREEAFAPVGVRNDYAGVTTTAAESVATGGGSFGFDEAKLQESETRDADGFLPPPAPAPATGHPAPAAPPLDKKSGATSLGTGADTAKPDTASAPRQIVYTGWLRLKVKRIEETLTAIEAYVAERGGRVDSLADRVVVVRVPVLAFDDAMGALARLGELLGRQVQASDVTDRMVDLEARRIVAAEARERLLALLAKATDAAERLAIVQEVKRLTETIEAIAAELSTLASLVSYSRITIELEPVHEAGLTPRNLSPFPWVRGLAAHRATLFEGGDRLSLPLPAGFVRFEDDEWLHASAADTCELRGGIVDNEPRGDTAFWVRAVAHELLGRGEERVESGDTAGLSFVVWRSVDVQPRYWLIALGVSGGEISVIEVFFPNEETFRARREAVLEALGGFRAEP